MKSILIEVESGAVDSKHNPEHLTSFPLLLVVSGTRECGDVEPFPRLILVDPQLDGV